MKTRVLAAIVLALGEDDVERPAPGAAPTAFRIWKAGINMTDYGPHVFSAESARLLMAEQATRGNRYSIDVDHLSLSKDAPPEARKAVGWNALGVRGPADAPDLWAVDVEWTDAVKAGLEKNPPEWKYFSPAYDVDKETGEIVAYLNTALTNNPATHFVTALATRQRIAATRESTMNISAIVAALMGDDDKAKEEAKAALASMSEEDREKCKAAFASAMKAAFPESGGGDGDGDEEKKKKEEAARAAKAAEEKEKQEAARRAAAGGVEATAALLVQLGDQDKRLKVLETETEEQKRTKMIASRTDLTEGQRKYLEGRPLKEVEQLLASPLLAPKGTPTTRAAAAQPGVTATRGRTQVGDGEVVGAVRATRSGSEEAEQIANRFGRTTKKPKVHWEGNELVLERISKSDALEILAARGVAAPVPRPYVPATLPLSMSDVQAQIPDIVRQTMAAALAAKGTPVTP